MGWHAAPGFHPNGLSVEHRLNRVLGELAGNIGIRDSRGTILDAAISHQALAELIGASRPKTTQAIGKLICSGKVVCDQRRLILVDEHRTAAGRVRLNPRLRHRN